MTPRTLKYVVVSVAVAVVVVSVVIGVVLIGSPAEQRVRKMDDRRTQDLVAISRALNLYWTRHKRLAASLEELSREPGVIVSADPDTREPYEYRVVGDKKYELCARFQRGSADEFPGTNNFWSHGAGRQCFQLEVNQTL